MPLREPPADPKPGSLDMATPEAVDGVIDLSPIVAAAWAAAGCDFVDLDRDYWGDPGRAWELRREAVADALLVDWHGIVDSRDGYACAAQGEIVTLADSPRHRCLARLYHALRGYWLMKTKVGGDGLRSRPGAHGISLCAYGHTHVKPALAYADRVTALRAAALECLGDLHSGRGSNYVRLIAKLEAVAAGAEPVPG